MKALVWFLSLSISVLFSGIAFAESTATVTPIRIGGAFALSGFAESYGDGEAKAAKLAIEEINKTGGVLGHPLEMVVEDTKSTQIGTVSAVTKLITIDKIDIIVGPTWLDSYQSAIPIAEKNGAFLITPSAVAGVMKKRKGESPHVFTTFFNTAKEITFLLQSVKQAGYKKIALVFDQDPFCEWFHNTLREQVKDLGLEITDDISVPIGTTDLRMQMAKLRDAQAILYGFVEGGTLMSFLKARQALLPKVELFGSHDTEGYITDPAYKGLYFGISYAMPADALPSFTTAYSAAYGESPKVSSSMSYDAVKIIAAALTKAKLDRNEFLKVLQTEEFETATFGVTGFDELGGVTAGNFKIGRVPF